MGVPRDLFFPGFQWAVPEAGCVWVDALAAVTSSWESGTDAAAKVNQLLSRMPKFWNWSGHFDSERQKWLVSVLMPRGGRQELRAYKPLREHTGLFREFAATEPTRDGIVAFANRYGRLGAPARIDILPPELDQDSEAAARWSMDLGEPVAGFPVRSGEPFGVWCYEILAMHRAVELWEMLRRKDDEGLAKRISWYRVPGEKVVVFYDDHLGDPPDFSEGLFTPERDHHIIASEQNSPEILEEFSPGDRYDPAWVYLERAIKERLTVGASPRPMRERNPDRLSLRISPNSLLGAMWLQFALAVEGNKEHRQCEACKTWFEVSAQAARTSKRYCRAACRVRAHRERQAQVQERARQLQGEGKSLKQIAKELDTDVKTIKGWLSDRKG
jgi:hypothetical protein